MQNCKLLIFSTLLIFELLGLVAYGDSTMGFLGEKKSGLNHFFSPLNPPSSRGEAEEILLSQK